MRSIAGGLMVLAGSVLASHAQTPGAVMADPSTGPHVESALKCIEHSVLANQRSLVEARRGNWSLAAERIGTACDGHIAQMIARIDGSFGSGAGRTFFEAAFRPGLGKVLESRLKPK